MNCCYRAMAVFCLPSYCSSIQLEIVFGNDCSKQDSRQNSQAELGLVLLLAYGCLFAIQSRVRETLLPLPDLFSLPFLYPSLHHSKSLHLTDHPIPYPTLFYCPNHSLKYPSKLLSPSSPRQDAAPSEERLRRRLERSHQEKVSSFTMGLSTPR